MVAAQDKELAQEWLHAEEWLQLKLKTKEFEAKYKYEATDMFTGGTDTIAVTL
ncbi:hypothetical protein JHK85_034910 [Glycine max]|nr:hypothetical protein JHK85_034910 [Glycine max]KAG4986573.1 hypothetical protein JHK86_034264 [Glycine max]